MNENWQEFRILDHPSILSMIFYPRADDYRLPDSDRITGLMVPAGDGIEISCQFYFSGKGNANMLFFHGNGELASEYEDAGLAYNGIGINLFVADYRGYGRSGGRPMVSAMIKDAHPIAMWFDQFLQDKGYSGNRFIMGRSLGSASAIELAAACPDGFKGMVIESGFCDVTDLLGRFGLAFKGPGQEKFASPGFDSVMKIAMPALIIHGEYDSIVPLAEGEKIYRNIASPDKKMVVIPEADHNTIFSAGMELYLRELGGFVQKHK